MKKLKTLLIVGALAISYSGCSHKNVEVVKSTDNKISCSEILDETAEVRAVKASIDEKTGFSGRNVAMGLFFWPGIVVNQMNAGDAREVADKRLLRLSELAEKKECDFAQSDIDKKTAEAKERLKDK